MGQGLNIGYKVFAVGFVMFSAMAALAFGGLLGFVLLTGQSISVMANPDLFPKADAYLVSDLVALAGITMALVSGMVAMVSDAREGMPLNPYKGHKQPSGMTLDWVWHLRPTMKLWFVGFFLALML